MWSRIAGTVFVLALCGWSALVSPAAAQQASPPRNFKVSNLTPGPGRFQVMAVYEWDAPAPNLTYQLNSGCAFKAAGLTFSGNSGLTIVSGGGPHYRLDATCNCDRYKYVGPAVRTYSPAYSVWVILTSPPAGAGPQLANRPGVFEFPCKQTR
jgi:hypothetical protein